MIGEEKSIANIGLLYVLSVVFIYLFFASVTKDQHLVVDQGGVKEKRVDLIEESDFVFFLLVAPGPGSCGRCASEAQAGPQG